MDLTDSPSFNTHVEKLMEDWLVPGFAIAISNGDCVLSRGYGSASLDLPKPCTPDSIFDIASCSKSLTAASVALLVDDNEQYPEVQWDVPMSKLLPEDFVMSEDSYTKSVTVEDILSHRSGLPSHDFSYLGIRAARTDNAQSVVRNLRNLPISAPVRSKYMYCNMMFTVATRLVEKVTGSSFGDFLQQHIFTPLGMRDSYLQPDAAVAAGVQDRIATPYKWNDKTCTYSRLPVLQSPEAQGAGSIFTSVNEYIKWVKAVMIKQPPITKSVYQDLTRPRIITAEPSEFEPRTSFSAYAAGWEVRYYRGYQVVQHDGLNYGFGGSHLFVPELNACAVMLGNSNGATTLASILAKELVDELLQVPVAERPNWDKLAHEQETRDDDSEQMEEDALRERLCRHGDQICQPQKTPLEAYTGEYWNGGYHGLTVGIKDKQLFVDASDRSMGFHLKFEHICDQTRYIAHLEDVLEGGDEKLAAEFRFDGGRAVRMGVKLEADMEDMIWFDRAE